MNHLAKVTTAATLMLGASLAHAEFTGSVDLTTNYVWRGISQSAGGLAAQGGVTYKHDSGFYIGAWASNVDFWESANGGLTDPTGAHLELDAMGGFSGTFANGIGWDVGVIRYNYPTANVDLGYNEFYVGGSYSVFSAKYSYANDFGNTGNNAYYIEAALNFTLPQEVGLILHAGHSGGDFWTAGTDYTDWKVGVSKEFAGFVFELDYTNTTGGVKNKVGANQNDGQFALMATKTF